MKKIILFIFAMAVLLLAEATKRIELSPYEPYSGVSQAVTEFFDDPSNSGKNLHVKIAYTDMPEDPSDEVIFEHKPKVGMKKIWINGLEVSEAYYSEYLKRISKRPYRSRGFDSLMSYEEIQSLLRGEERVFVDVYQLRENDYYPAYDSLLQVSKITTNAFGHLYNGNGVGVYFSETGCPDLSEVNTSYYSQGYGVCPNGTQWHATGVALVLQAAAPQSQIYGFDNVDYPNPDTVSPAIDIGSQSWSYSATGTYDVNAMLMDNYIYEHRVTNFVAAGNKKTSQETFNVKSPGIAVNAITVGAVNPRNNSYDAYSRWINSNVGNQKPELANYAEFYFPNFGDYDGTSAATPYSAAMAADLMSQYPDIKRHPEIVKAYMLVQNGRTIFAGNNHDQDNSTDAALEVPYFNDQPDVTSYAYWNGNNDCCFSNGSIELTETGILSGHRYKIAIAWLVPGTYVLQYGYLSQDIDIDVYQGNTLIAYSNSGTDPFEMVDFTAQTAQDLRIVITRFSNSGYGKVALGYAMWHN